MKAHSPSSPAATQGNATNGKQLLECTDTPPGDSPSSSCSAASRIESFRRFRPL